MHVASITAARIGKYTCSTAGIPFSKRDASAFLASLSPSRRTASNSGSNAERRAWSNTASTNVLVLGEEALNPAALRACLDGRREDGLQFSVTDDTGDVCSAFSPPPPISVAASRPSLTSAGSTSAHMRCLGE